MSKYVGRKFTNQENLEYIVLSIFQKKTDGKPKSLYRIRFLETGYEKEVTSDHIRKGNIVDKLSPSLCGVGIIGHANTRQNYKSYLRWRGMIYRCYKTSDERYPYYGGRGVRVCDRWLRFDHFLEDIPKIDGYDEKLYLEGILQLDKDKKQLDVETPNKIYSLDTCTWMTGEENRSYMPSHLLARKFIAISPRGIDHIGTSTASFAKENNLNHRCISRCLNGKQRKHRGWTFRPM